MHRDQKIGLSLGVLLVGFSAAFCFRHEPLCDPPALAMDQAAALDTRIEQLSVRTYTQREGVGRVDRGATRVDSATDLVDASFVERPLPAFDVEDVAVGDEVEVYCGPPEPMLPRNLEADPQNSCTIALAAVTAPAALSAPGPEIAPMPPTQATHQKSDEKVAGSAPRTYVVKTGDTLSGVSLAVYGTTRRYLEIFQANRDVLRDPDDLPVGTSLRIP